jgi:hypothetical protein
VGNLYEREVRNGNVFFAFSQLPLRVGSLTATLALLKGGFELATFQLLAQRSNR